MTSKTGIIRDRRATDSYYKDHKRHCGRGRRSGRSDHKDDEDKVIAKLAKVPAITDSGMAPNVDFAVHAIQAGREGMAKASEAAQMLTFISKWFLSF
ncbi:hypothetical protein CWM47_13815 [Spirosoma pollinicola]|uniref:Uncharacterized protein n=1 Tax=Spirosoma pollinicola TaxID=2057025 RepID=A0A2K8YZ12_9BACT|nr:hypothetical protein CWM47_13815 [Spirosoma pollinicola]